MSRQPFTSKQKWEILLEALASTTGPDEVCRRHRIDLAELRNWLKTARAGALGSLTEAGRPTAGVEIVLPGQPSSRSGLTGPRSDPGARDRLTGLRPDVAAAVNPEEQRATRLADSPLPLRKPFRRPRRSSSRPPTSIRDPAERVVDLSPRVPFPPPPVERGSIAPHPRVMTTDEVDAMFSMFTHESKEPLRGLKGICQVVREDYGTSVPAEVERYFESLSDIAARMELLVNGLSEYASCPQRVRYFRPCAMPELVREVRTGLRPYVAARAGQVVVDSRLPIVRGDSDGLGVVFRHLVQNGIKFNESSAPRVQVVAMTSTKDERFAVIEVRDDGIGIDSTHHETVFELFQRLNRYVEYPGAGVGLAVANRIVEAHGGTIELSSALGKGSTFRVRLPLDLPPE